MNLGNRILVRSPNWLGDAVMTLPAIQAWQPTLSSETKVAILTPGYLADLWKEVPGVDTIISSNPNIAISSSEIKSWEATGAIVLPNSLRTALEPFLAQIPIRIGFKGRWRSFLLTSHFDRPKQLGPLHHQSQDYVDLFHHFGLLKSNEKQTLRALPKSHPPRIDSAYLLVCPGAEYGSAKRWPADHFAKAAAELARENSYRIVIAGGEGDLETAQQVERYLRGSSTINLTGSTTLSQFLTLCAHASFILCNDSGAMHTSSLYHTPGVALFGSTEPRWTGPLSPAMTVVQEDVPCSPCFLRECPIDFRCMRTLSVEMVLQACQDTLQRA